MPLAKVCHINCLDEWVFHISEDYSNALPYEISQPPSNFKVIQFYRKVTIQLITCVT